MAPPAPSALTEIRLDLSSVEETGSGSAAPFLDAARKAVQAEIELADRQMRRDDSFPEDARAPFHATMVLGPGGKAPATKS